MAGLELPTYLGKEGSAANPAPAPKSKKAPESGDKDTPEKGK
jgi:hypothetical protein